MTLPPPPPPPPTPPSRAPRPHGAVRFSVFDAGMVVLAYFVGQLFLGVAAGVVFLGRGQAPGDVGWMVTAIIATVGGFAFALGWLGMRRRLDRAILGTRLFGIVPVALGLGVGVLGTLATYLVNALVGLVVRPDAPVEQQVLRDALAGGTSLLLAAIVAIVLAPIVEEVLFRGILFQALRRRVGLWPAAVLSSGLFAVIHVEILFSQPLALAGLFVFGVLLAWSFARTSSLLVPILGHAVFNAVSIGLAVTLDRFGVVA